MEIKRENNYAFIDTQNIVRGLERLGWFIDWKKFRVYLEHKYHVTKAFLFLGYLYKNERTYKELRAGGFELIFKEVYEFEGKIKGNIDVELAMQVFIEMNNFDKAVIVSGDGDFQSLVKYLKEKDKFRVCIAVSAKECSAILKKYTAGKLGFIDALKEKISILEIK
jgi:uncharacterized LabA/DUF88 family protein